jgi:pimeloyl-ACP methyl ester carboxylesterase
VKATYHVDDRRVVIAGHNAGALMSWRMMTREPTLWAGIVTMSGEIPEGDRNSTALKALVGKSIYVFRGDKDNYFTQNMFDRDKKYLESMKIPATYETQKDWSTDFPRGNIGKIAAWVDAVYPAGPYREKADAAEKAIEAKDIAAATVAMAGLRAALKKNPYPAFEAKADALQKALLDLGRIRLDQAKRLLEAGQGLLALEAAEAAATALKGLKPLDAEAAAALAAARKSPVVLEALRKKEAESTASSTMERAAAAEAKGDFARALELYKKVAALGETTKKAEAEQKIQEIEPKVAGK